MSNAKAIIESLLLQAGIIINGPNPWDIQVHDEKLFKEVLSNAELAYGETYVEGRWDVEALDECFYRILSSEMDTKVLKAPQFWLTFLHHFFLQIKYKLFNYQTQHHSGVVGKKHYDISYDLFEKMLDKRLTYTCGYWEHAKTLDEAQEHKLEMVCQKISLKPGMKILDIGCGWGSFAKYAAEKYQAEVTGLTISEEQFKKASELCQGLPVEIRCQDYRELLNEKVQFDHVISLGMFEHVGYKNYKTYMHVVSEVLKDDGLFLLHTIGSNVSGVITNAWFNKYIFPNGHLPSIAQIAQATEKVFVMEDWHNFGVDYDKTLMAWHENFIKNWPQLKSQYDDHFYRMWRFYLLTSAASFRARHNQLWQILFSKRGLKDGFKKRCLDLPPLESKS